MLDYCKISSMFVFSSALICTHMCCHSDVFMDEAERGNLKFSSNFKHMLSLRSALPPDADVVRVCLHALTQMHCNTFHSVMTSKALLLPQ